MTWLLPERTALVWGDGNLRADTNLALPLFSYVKNQKEKEDRTPAFDAIANVFEAGSPEELKALSVRRCSFLETVGATHLPLKLTDEYTCGLSHGSVLQNAMTVLPPWGIPVVTAEGQKGVLKHWLGCLLLGNLTVRDTDVRAELRKRGMLSLFELVPGAQPPIQFFDAWPAYDRKFGLKVTGTTVHHQAWYGDERGRVPDGIENPNPIPFLAVRRGTIYDFAYLLPETTLPWSPDVREDTAQQLDAFGIGQADLRTRSTFVRALLLSAAMYDGFGARTNVGHGRFK